MRSYIFTSRERETIRMFLDGKIPVTNHLLSQIRTRVKKLKGLSGDVDLYLQLRALAEAEAAASA